MKNVLLILILLFGAAALANDREVVLYSGKDFSGASMVLTEDAPNMKHTALGNDRASSIRIPAGCRVTLYEAGGYKGRSIMLFYDHADFSALNLDRKLSSVKIDWSTISDELDGVVLYSETGYRGRSETLTEDDRNLKGNFIGNDRVQSLRVPRGWSVTVFEHRGFRGKSETFRGDDPDLRDNRIGLDRISSVQIKAPKIRIAPRRVVLFQHGDFRGRFDELTADDPDLSDNQIGNDALSSIRVPPGAEVTLYEHANFGGRTIVLTQDTASFRSGNDSVSSIRIRWSRRWEWDPPVNTRPERAPEAGVVLFRDHQYRGPSAVIVEDCPDLGETPLGNDSLSSIRVPKGYRVILYEHANYKGRSEILTEDDPDLENNRIGKDCVSSLRIERTLRRRRAR